MEWRKKARNKIKFEKKNGIKHIFGIQEWMFKKEGIPFQIYYLFKFAQIFHNQMNQHIYKIKK